MKEDFVRHVLTTLSCDIGCRPAGSAAHRLSEDLIANNLRTNDYSVEIQHYNCPDWKLINSDLKINGKTYPAIPAVHSPSCRIKSVPVILSNEQELLDAHISGKIAVLCGELSEQSYFPKNFDFFRFENQDRIIAIIEEKKPAALILIAHRRENHTSLMEDSEFAFPVMTVSEEVGEAIRNNTDVEIEMMISAMSEKAMSSNIIGRMDIKSEQDERIVICAHFDTKHGTPGAIDNAAGTAAMLLAAKLIKGVRQKNPGSFRYGIEIVAFGGEDSWYPGDASYFSTHSYFPEKIKLAINIDGAGVIDENDTIALLECSDIIEQKILNMGKKYPGILKTEPWYESDHSFFSASKIPTLAFTTQNLRGITDKIVHTPYDTIEKTDSGKIAEVAEYISEIVIDFDNNRD